MTVADAQARWSILMDEAVAETFTAMLGLGCKPSPSSDGPPPRISALIEFSGTVQGTCTIAMSNADALRIVETSFAGEADDAMAADTVGELCNVLAGSWKRRLKRPASAAGLSIPAIVRDNNGFPCGVRRAYECRGARLVVRLCVQQMQEE